MNLGSKIKTLFGIIIITAGFMVGCGNSEDEQSTNDPQVTNQEQSMTITDFAQNLVETSQDEQFKYISYYEQEDGSVDMHVGVSDDFSENMYYSIKNNIDGYNGVIDSWKKMSLAVLDDLKALGIDKMIRFQLFDDNKIDNGYSLEFENGEVTFNYIEDEYNKELAQEDEEESVSEEQQVIEDVEENVDTEPEVTTDMVWLSATGDKAHSIPNCGRMNPNTARNVPDRGYDYCSKCW